MTETRISKILLIFLVTTLLSVLIAVALATAARATPIYKWQCGEFTVSLQYKPPHQVSDGKSSYGYVSFEPYFPNRDIHFVWDIDHNVKDTGESGDWPTMTGGEAFLNGKRCKDYVKKNDGARVGD